MYQPQTISDLQQFFKPKGQREPSAVYCYRFNGYNEDIKSFLQEYYKLAQSSGLVQEGKIPNPTEGNLTYYTEIIGDDFELSVDFCAIKLQKWLPRLSPQQNDIISTAIYETLFQLQGLGKNLSILKNIYTKFMCWMYYRFERLLRQLGSEQVPKILYEGNISDYELRMLTVCAKAGCDLVLLQYEGDESYKKLDSNNLCSKVYQLSPTQSFPDGFSLKTLREAEEKQSKMGKLYPPLSNIKVLCNQWEKGTSLEDILNSQRDTTMDGVPTCFRAMVGVEDKVTYLPELYRFHQELLAKNRTVVILEGLPLPTPDEIQKIPRQNYQTTEQMLFSLVKNISLPKYIEIEKLLGKVYLDCLLSDDTFKESNLNRQTTQSIYLLCWIKRYQNDLFKQWSADSLPCVILLNVGQTANECLFIQLLSQLPVDVFLLAPDLQKEFKAIPHLLGEKHSESLVVDRFPTGGSDVQMGTTAYHAERELDTLMYTDSGMYRNQQYQRANAIVLRTMYEEIALLWDTELKFRPNFNTLEDTVHLPVLFAKVSGVKDGNAAAYWNGIKQMNTPETLLISAPPYIGNVTTNPMNSVAPSFYKGGKLQREAIKKHPQYSYSFLRQETQDYILEKLDLFLADKNIKGMGVNGTEFTVIAQILNLNHEILRMIQNFDFTKKNPKILYIHTREGVPSKEDGILLAFLSKVGFDVVMFVPTGYQGVEIHYERSPVEEHQIGSYIYDLQVPKLTKSQLLNDLGKKIFKRGG